MTLLEPFGVHVVEVVKSTCIMIISDVTNIAAVIDVKLLDVVASVYIMAIVNVGVSSIGTVKIQFTVQKTQFI